MFTHRITIHIGLGEDRHGKPITLTDAGDIRADILAEACRLFGGATMVRGIGGWLNPQTGRIVEESAAVLTVYGKPERADDMARYCVQRANQSSVLLAVERMPAMARFVNAEDVPPVAATPATPFPPRDPGPLEDCTEIPRAHLGPTKMPNPMGLGKDGRDGVLLR